MDKASKTLTNKSNLKAGGKKHSAHRRVCTAIEAMRNIQKIHGISEKEIREWINEGRQ